MNIAQQVRQEGRLEGLEKGRLEGLLDVARTMLSDRTALKTVAPYTKLSLDKIKKLQQALDKT